MVLSAARLHRDYGLETFKGWLASEYNNHNSEKKTSATSPNLNVKILARMGFRHEFRRRTDGSAWPSWLLNPGTRTVAFGLQKRLPPEAPALGCFNAETAQAPSLDIEALGRSASVAGLGQTCRADNELKLVSARPGVISNHHLFKSQQTEIPFLFLLR